MQQKAFSSPSCEPATGAQPHFHLHFLPKGPLRIWPETAELLADDPMAGIPAVRLEEDS